jgi:hypothetical protein
MGIIEWIVLAVVIIAAYNQFKKQEYWLDRQVAKAIGFMRLQLSKLFHKER